MLKATLTTFCWKPSRPSPRRCPRRNRPAQGGRQDGRATAPSMTRFSASPTWPTPLYQRGKHVPSDAVEEALDQAGGQRMQAVLIGLIAECDQLLQVAASKATVRETVEEITSFLVWNAPDGRTFTTAVAMLQTRLVALGWPVILPTGHRLY